MVNPENELVDKAASVTNQHEVRCTHTLDNKPPQIDVFRKLILIAGVLKDSKFEFRKNSSSISKEVLVKFGTYIDPEECTRIIKKYGFLIRRNHALDISLTVFTYAGILYSELILTWVGFSLALILAPLVFNFYSAIIININILFFSPASLRPFIHDNQSLPPSTAIVIASRNEPFLVAKMTFDSAVALRYPHNKKEIIVVDNSDSHFPEYQLWKNYVESFSEHGPNKIDGVRVVFIHRNGVEGYKPRNLDLAIDAVTSDLVMYLDVDSTVSRDTLLQVTSLFNLDKKMGFVQLYTIPTNIHGKSPLAFVQSLRNYFLRLEMVFLTHASHSLFFGHNAIWRTNVVRQLGACLEYHRGEVVVTEDLSMSFRARFKGYHGIGAWVESGEWVPESMRETEAMWLRWTVGTYQVYAKHFTQLKSLKSFSKRELLGWAQNLGYSVNYGLVPLYAVLGLWLNSTFLMLMLVMSLLPDAIQALCAFYKLSLGNMNKIKKVLKCYEAFFILSTFINWVRCMGLLRYIMGVKQGWVPTGKSSENEIPITRVIKDRFGFLIFGIACSSYSGFLLTTETLSSWNTFLTCAVGLYGINSLLCIYLFGRARMQEELAEVTERRKIDSYCGFFDPASRKI